MKTNSLLSDKKLIKWLIACKYEDFIEIAPSKDDIDDFVRLISLLFATYEKSDDFFIQLLSGKLNSQTLLEIDR